MGNQVQNHKNHSPNQTKTFTQIQHQNIPIESLYINHPRFHKVPILQKNGTKFLLITLPVQNQQELYEWQKKQKIIKQLSKENLFVKKSYQFQRQGLCGASGHVKIEYEYYPNLLIDEITNRRVLQHLFQQTEIWYLLYTLISVANDFENLNLKVGDIRPENIYINQQGVIKIANIFSWPNEETNYFKSLQNGQLTYLSPQQLKDLQNFRHNQSTNDALSQSFSIALTTLDAALLKNSKALYSFKNQTWKFNQQQCSEMIQQWKNSRYSDFLKKIVLNLINLDVKQRKKPSEIVKLLQPYRQNIQNLIPFNNNSQQKKKQNNLPLIQPETPQFIKKNQKLKHKFQLFSYTIPKQHFTTIKTPFHQQDLNHSKHFRSNSQNIYQLNLKHTIKRKNFVYSSNLFSPKFKDQFKLQSPEHKDLLDYSKNSLFHSRRRYNSQKLDNNDTESSSQPYSIPFIATQKKIWQPNDYFNKNQKKQEFDYPTIVINGGYSIIKY